MQKQEKQEQPKERKGVPTDKDIVQLKEYFWSGSVYTLVNRKTENCFGIVKAVTGQEAVDVVKELYSVPARFRNFALVALTRV